MPTHDEAMLLKTAHQMIKCGKSGVAKVTSKQLKLFMLRHEIHIKWAVENLPSYASAAVAAVIVKALIKYDKQKVAIFCKRLKKGLFEGTNDPVLLLWKFLQIHRGYNTKPVYQRTVSAIRAFAEDKTLGVLAPAKRDIFDWDDDFSVPDDLIDNWNPNEIPTELEEILI